MSSSFISRIISMRDANGPRRKSAISSKNYAMASPPDLYDDSESDDADDEYETGDEHLIISSSDSANEQGQAEDCESVRDDIAVEDGSSSLEIIDNYFNDPNIVFYQEFHHGLLNSSEETGEDSPPVIKLNLASPPDVANNVAVTNSLGDTHVALQEITSALDLQDEKRDRTERWSLVSASFHDNWARKLEAAQEDDLMKDEETTTVSKVRQPSQTTAISTRSARSGRPRNRMVAFTLRPNVFDEPSS